MWNQEKLVQWIDVETEKPQRIVAVIHYSIPAPHDKTFFHRKYMLTKKNKRQRKMHSLQEDHRSVQVWSLK